MYIATAYLIFLNLDFWFLRNWARRFDMVYLFSVGRLEKSTKKYTEDSNAHLNVMLFKWRATCIYIWLYIA